MKYMENHPVNYSEGAGHKVLLAKVTSPTTIYLSSVPGVTSDMYGQFTEDNFICIEGTIWATIPGNAGTWVYASSENGKVEYDPSNGSVKITPMKFTQHCNYPPPSDYMDFTESKYVETAVYFLK